MEKITFCIPSKNNRRYLEACIPSIRKNAYRPDHDIIVFVDEDNDGTVKRSEEHTSELQSPCNLVCRLLLEKKKIKKKKKNKKKKQKKHSLYIDTKVQLKEYRTQNYTCVRQ